MIPTNQAALKALQHAMPANAADRDVIIELIDLILAGVIDLDAMK